jgi:hypothetical protein
MMNSGYSTAATVAKAKRTHRCADFATDLGSCGAAFVEDGAAPRILREIRGRSISPLFCSRKSHKGAIEGIAVNECDR